MQPNADLKELPYLSIDFYYRGIYCREHTLLPDTEKNRRKIQKVVARIEHEITSGTFNYYRYFPNSPMVKILGIDESLQLTTPIFKEFCEEWFSEYQIQWKRSYIKNIRGTLDKHLIPAFGNLPVGSIKKSNVMKFRSYLASLRDVRGVRLLSNDRINHVLTALRMILECAAERYDFQPPMVGVKPLKVEQTDVDPFSFSDVQRLLDHVRSDFRDYFLVRFLTGLRTAEIDGLQWQYVDVENRLILIRETVVQGRIESTKTTESRREVAMSNAVYEALLRQKERAYPGSPFVFTNSKGKPLEHRNVAQRVWYPLLEHLGMKKRRPYQTRHTAATFWLAAGENPEWVARQMGHSNTKMLFTVYSRFVPNLTRRDGSAMETLLAEKGF